MDCLRPYEILLIVDPRPTDEEVTQLLTRLQDTLKELGASVQRVDNWGKRRLAYEIRKQREGTYGVFQVRAEPATVKEFERQLKLNESVLRFMTTRVVERRRKGTPAEPAPAPEPTVEEVG